MNARPKADLAPWIAFLLVWGILAALLAAAGVAPGVPYNVRELFAGPRGWMAAIALPLVAALWFGAPAAAMAWIAGHARRRAAVLPVLAVAFALLAFALLRATVSVESIWDIVGFPVLHGPGDWEICGRFVALFSVVWTLVAGGMGTAFGLPCRRRHGSFGLPCRRHGPFGRPCQPQGGHIGPPLHGFSSVSPLRPCSSL